MTNTIAAMEYENAALQAEVSRLTENQLLQDSATAAVLERAEKAEAEVKEQCRLHAMGSEREAKLMARVAELERDAGRYRFLRKGDVTFEAEDGPCFVSYIPELGHDGSNLDQSIDAAMRGTE